jgi:hypothetical protein
MRSRSSHYIFSLKADDLWRKREQRSRLYLGKLRAVTGNDYVLYDNGVYIAPNGHAADDDAAENDDVNNKSDNKNSANAKDKNNNNNISNNNKDGEELSLYRKELVVIHFNSKTRPAKEGVRGCEICIPNITANNSNIQQQQQQDQKQQQQQHKQVSSESKSSSNSQTSSATPSNNNNNSNMYTIYKQFERVREVGKQNELLAKTCFVMHERTSK